MLHVVNTMSRVDCLGWFETTGYNNALQKACLLAHVVLYSANSVLAMDVFVLCFIFIFIFFCELHYFVKKHKATAPKTPQSEKRLKRRKNGFFSRSQQLPRSIVPDVLSHVLGTYTHIG